jgi:glycosyltransferase involved in cell wall biosynthesis
MRIAIYHHLHSGGAKRVVMEHAYRLSARHDVTVFTLSTADQSFGHWDQAPPFRVSVLPFRSPAPFASPWGRLNPVVALAALRRLDRLAMSTARQIDGSRFDVVLVHPCQMTQTPLLLRWLRTPTLYYCHELPRRLYERPVTRAYRERGLLRGTLDGVDPLPALQGAIFRLLDRHCARKATRIAVNSRFTGEKVRSAYHRAGTVCMPAVEAMQFQPGINAREPFVLSVGALTPNKGFDFLIAALATITSAVRPGLVIISNYEERQEHEYLSSLASQCGVTVEFHVGVTEAQLRDWYARAGCVAYAPVNEPLGLVTLEAMASAAPLVAVREGGVSEPILDGLTGLSVPRDPVIFGEAICRLLLDRPGAAALGEQGRRHVLANCNWDTHIEHLESLLRDIQSPRRAGVPARDRRFAL